MLEEPPSDINDSLKQSLLSLCSLTENRAQFQNLVTFSLKGVVKIHKNSYDNVRKLAFFFLLPCIFGRAEMFQSMFLLHISNAGQRLWSSSLEH